MSWCNLCYNIRRVNSLHRNLLPKMNFATVTPQVRRYSEKVEKNAWKDGAVVYSTSKAAKHKVNTTIGLDMQRKVTYKPLVGGIITFTVLMYYMFLYDGEQNDVFQTVTPESIKEQYLQSVNQTNVFYVVEEDKEKEVKKEIEEK